MLILKRIAVYCLFMILFNIILLAHWLTVAPTILLGLALAVFYVYCNIGPLNSAGTPGRLTALRVGRELTLVAIVCSTLEVLLYGLFVLLRPALGLWALIGNALLSAALLYVVLCNGVIRIMLCSRQLPLAPRLLLLLFWWLPVINFALLHILLSSARSEYEFSLSRRQYDADRRRKTLCRTRYPIVLVHGIFFRDWSLFNYWGRIPDELTANGARLFYGGQQSATSVEQSAAELKRTVLDILEQTGCEKVNIIAHSKGGLDARYMISCLQAGQYVASLTTVNTPHRGCSYLPKLMDKISQRTIKRVGDGYNKVFSMLGDDSPDLISGLRDLTDRECARLNTLMIDDPGVLYQSVGSRMRSFFSAAFPLNAGYALIKRYTGDDNDGLVTTQSMQWGHFLGLVNPRGQKGVSHGDMIDLTRRNIEGFDICEFYVNLVYKLQQQGY